MNNQLLKSLLPYLAAIGLFIVISLAYFTPDIFQGKVLYQNDVTSGMAAGSEAAAFQKKTGEKTLWTNNLFSGMPTYQISPKYSSSFLIRELQSLSGLYLPNPANIVFMMLLGAFLLFLALGTGVRVAILGAIAYTFSSYFFILIHAGHIWKFLVLAYIPPTFAGIIWAYRGKYLLGGLVAALFASLQLLSNHPQMTYYFGLLVLIYLIAEFVHCYKNKQLPHFLKASAILVLAGGIALAINSTNLYHSYQYAKYTMRGPSELTDGAERKTSGGIDRDYATQWSYGIGETFTLLIPDTKGGSTGPLAADKKALQSAEPQYRPSIEQQNRYWGDQPFTEGPVYVGAFIMFLFVLGLFIVPGRMKWVLLAGTILSIFLSWGHNMMWFTNLFLDYFPMYNKFRTVSSILVIAELTIPILAILALVEILKKPSLLQEQKKNFYISIGATAGLTLIFLIIPSVFNFVSKPEAAEFAEYLNNPRQAASASAIIHNLEAVRIAIFRADALRSLFILAIGIALLVVFSRSKENTKWKSIGLVTALTVLVLFDMTLVNKRYLNNKAFQAKRNITNLFPETAVDKEILKDTDLYYRVFNLTVDPFQDPSTSVRHKSIGGYSAVKLRRYQDLIDKHLSKMNASVINMLNTKYLIIPGANKQPYPQLNPDALGNAWFVDKVQWVASPDEEIAALNGFDPATTAVADKRFETTLPANLTSTVADSSATIRLLTYAPNYLTYESESAYDKLAVFSDIYYPHGWHAYIDGKEVKHLRVNYVLRALSVPAGKHTIAFKFDPKSYHVTESLAYTASGILVLMFLSVVLIEIRNRRRCKKGIDEVEK